MNLIAWDAAICHLYKHGRWDKKRNHKRVDVGVTGMFNSERTSASFGLPLPRLLGHDGLSVQQWSVSLCNSATRIIHYISGAGPFFGRMEIFPQSTVRHALGAGRISPHNCAELLSLHISNKLSDHFDSHNSSDPNFAPVVSIVNWMRLTSQDTPQRAVVSVTGRKSIDVFLSKYSHHTIVMKDVCSFLDNNIPEYCTKLSGAVISRISAEPELNEFDWIMVDGDLQLMLHVSFEMCSAVTFDKALDLIAAIAGALVMVGPSKELFVALLQKHRHQGCCAT
jgi:hypothetical protein